MEFQTVDPLSIPEGATLIDIREDNEWEAGHAPTARHIPASQLASRLDDLFEGGDDDDIYVVCRGGGRSYQVAQWLESQGIEVINVGGGMDAWVEQGLPIESDGPGDARII